MNILDDGNIQEVFRLPNETVQRVGSSPWQRCCCGSLSSENGTMSQKHEDR